MSTKQSDYGLAGMADTGHAMAPELDYRPRDPRGYRPAIGVIGCGGISGPQLAAYSAAGYHVVALCDPVEQRAQGRREEYYPQARVFTDYRDVLRRDDIEVVDIATHPGARVPIVEAALRASKHVLSQKPFALDLDWGERMVELAARQAVRLAVNQNGRWAPHFSYLRRLVADGHLGRLVSADLTVHWNHRWVVGTPFDEIDDLVLYDFAIHWFDIVSVFFAERRPNSVFAATARGAGQKARPPLLAHALIEFDDAQATLVFNADVEYGQQDRTFLAGTEGTATSIGPSLSEQQVTLDTVAGTARPALEGTWFEQGFHGTMAELLCAIDEQREPSNSAHSALTGLALAFAAIASTHDGMPKVPGQVRRLPKVS